MVQWFQEQQQPEELSSDKISTRVITGTPLLLPVVISVGSVALLSSVNVLEQVSAVLAPLKQNKIYVSFFVFFRWRYSPLWALACRTIPLHFDMYMS